MMESIPVTGSPSLVPTMAPTRPTSIPTVLPTVHFEGTMLSGYDWSFGRNVALDGNRVVSGVYNSNMFAGELRMACV